MPKPQFVRLRADIRFTTLYVCACCGATEQGTLIFETFQGTGPDDLRDFLNAHQQRSHDMPVGWSFNGKFKCSVCKDSKS